MKYIYKLLFIWDQKPHNGEFCIERFYYDPFGRRLWKEVQGTRTYFHYSDEGLIGEYDSTGAEIKSYGYKPGSTWTTDPLFVKENGQYYFYHNDHLGTPQKITAVNGAVVWSAKYSSFGKANVETETVENNLRFPGQYEDAETGLHYNYHRYYDPETGRYTRTDPMGLDGGINLFVYGGNNPIYSIDPKGLAYSPPGEHGQDWDDLEYVPADPEINDVLDPIDVFDDAEEAEARNFPGITDPYGGGYRHCVAACLLYKRYGPVGEALVYAHDYFFEDPCTEDSQGDIIGEDYGLEIGKKGGSCEKGCKSYYP